MTDTSTISQPNATLYVSNMDWSIKKPLLRRALYSLFSRHGKILEVITLRHEGLRGQAWIIFEDVASSTAAVQAENGFVFFNKPLKVAYAREKSDRIAKRDGTYVPKAKRRKLQQRGGAAITEPPTTSTTTTMEATNVDMTNAPDEAAAPPPPEDDAVPQQDQTSSVPSHILFAENLPTECNEMMLAMLFRQYRGYKEVRIPRQGLAFIEFEDEPLATLALQGLNGFKLTTNDTLNLTYGKS